MNDRSIYIENIGGNCPVQIEGYFGKEYFYFRARGNAWSLEVSENAIVDSHFTYVEPYKEDQSYAAGWMPLYEAIQFLGKGLQKYVESLG